MRLLSIFIVFLFCSCLPLFAGDQTVIYEDTVWNGEVSLSEDVLVLPGATLTIQAGTNVVVSPSESTQTQPEFLSPLTEITVRGNLVVNGSESSPVMITMPGADNNTEWAGIYIDGGSLQLSHTTISGADVAVTVINGTAEISESALTGNRHGLIVMQPEAVVSAKNSKFIENKYGIILLNGAKVAQQDCTIRDNEKQDVHEWDTASHIPTEKVYTATEKDDDSAYNSESLLSTVIWKDKVVVNGIVRVPAKSRLIIMPGTVVEFTKSDTNNDGIGENGLLVMGMLIAKGTEEQPIIFRSAEKNPQRGDWDAINIYTSDGFQNLIEYCQIEHAYRAIHLHYSNVVINNSILRNNYRALQFQESLVSVSGNDIYDNKSAMRARDSELLFTDNRIYNNYLGPYIFRITGKVTNNSVIGNALDGLRIREGALAVEGNYLAGNKYGLAVAYAMFGNFTGNVMNDNVESGIALKGTDRVDVAGNFVQSNGGNGISLLNSKATIKGNHISDNIERGIGINSFNGLITENNLLNNKLYAIGLESADDVSAPGNWYGNADLDKVIFDKKDDPSKGSLDYKPVRKGPVPYTWPLAAIDDDTTWEGEFIVPQRLDVNVGSTLRIAPGSVIKFGKKSSLWAFGNFDALGTPERRIKFSALEKTDNKTYWDQLTTERASARFFNCDFENAFMAVHVHFSDVEVRGCTFRNNDSGVRFRGGPVEISNSLFEKNVYGMVSYLARGDIRDNIFTNNDIGILIRAERNGGMKIEHNNIFDNHQHNLRMGDFNPEQDVTAKNNWWGTGDPAENIFDERDEPGIGMAFYEPYAVNAFSIEVKSEK
ncbi:MAG: right-handed parallel beta-helix repeat-containing protein [Chloroflexota bacterium]|nr:MAG: right-handed parallel beta-helix repeat-containing protein [Chloroflexota bacterium]